MRGTKDDSKVFGLSVWKDGAAADWEEDHWENKFEGRALGVHMRGLVKYMSYELIMQF
jgi:hypothetical protein